MLRINLLPAYIAERKRTRLAIAAASALFLAVTGLGLGYHFGVVQPRTEQMKTDATSREADAQRVNDLAAKAQAERQKIQPIADKVDFVQNVRFHNTIRGKLYRNAARYTDREVEYTGMAANGGTLNINAYVNSLADLGRFYITFFGNPDVTAVSIQGIHGWPKNAQQNPNFAGSNPFGQQAPPAAAQWFPVQLVATLVRPVVTPQLPASLGAGGQQGGGMMGGYPGGGGGYPGMGMGGGPAMSGPPMDVPPDMGGGAGAETSPTDR